MRYSVRTVFVMVLLILWGSWIAHRMAVKVHHPAVAGLHVHRAHARSMVRTTRNFMRASRAQAPVTHLHRPVLAPPGVDPVEYSAAPPARVRGRPVGRDRTRGPPA